MGRRPNSSKMVACIGAIADVAELHGTGLSQDHQMIKPI
jgi:hypothetical protein